MSHSTFDETTSSLQVLFSFENKDVIVTISSEMSYCCNFIDNDADVPSNIITHQNVPVVLLGESLQHFSDSPIILYVGNDKRMPNILLLEESRYYLQVDGSCDSFFEYLVGNTDCFFFHSVPKNSNLFILSSKSYVGKGFIDVTIDGMLLSVPFEVRSKKIDYFSQYPLMLRDLAEFSTSLLLDSKTPLFRSYDAIIGDRETMYETFLILEYIFDQLEFENNYEYVRNNCNSELIRNEEYSPAFLATDIDISGLITMMQGSNVIETKNGLICGRYCPINVVNGNYEDSKDTPENRLVKDLLLTLQSIVYALDSLINNSHYLEERISEMKTIIDSYMCDQWLVDIGSLSFIPSNSTVLNGKRGYRDLYLIYQMLGMNVKFHQNDIEYLLNGHGKRVYELYEYWCYIHLHRCL